jgi:hypothetical protein
MMRRHWKRILFGLLILLVLALAGVRLALPTIIRDYVNRKLDEIPDYTGRVGDIDIHLIRGAYTINAVDVMKTTGNVKIPFFSARKVDLSVEWRELFHRAIVGEIHVYDGNLNFVKAEKEEDSQTSIDKSWLDVVKDLFPFRINRFEIHNGEVWFRDAHANPRVDVYLTNLVVVCTNLYNTRKLENELPADFRAKGTTLGNGDVDVDVRLDPLAEDPKFDLELTLRGMDLVALNDLLEAYGKFHVKRGTFEVFSEIAGENGRFDGYVKPFFEDLAVLDLQKDAKHPLKLVWQAIVAGAVNIFKNHPKDQVATKIPVSGTFENTHVEVWTTVVNVLRNAFVQAFQARLDKTIDIFDQSEQGKQKENPKDSKARERDRKTES